MSSEDQFEALVTDLSEALAMFDAGEASADDVVTNLRNSLGGLR